MPARKTTFRCQCFRCCEVDVQGIPRNPHGKYIPLSWKAAHLQRTGSDPEASSDERLRSVKTLAEANLQSTEMNDINSLGARVFATTLADDGVDCGPQPSKLWSSRQEFQLHANEHSTTGISIPNLDDVATSVARLAISHGFQQQHPEASNPPSATLNTSNASGMHSLRSHTLRASDHDCQSTPYTAPDRKRDRRTAAAHTRLNAIESRLNALLFSSGEDNASTPLLRQVQEEAISLKGALNIISRREQSVQDRKQNLLNAVEEILSAVTAKEAQPSGPKLATQYNCDHHYHRPVDRCNEVAQVSIFLGVLCAVVLGISRRASDLIMGLISLILQLAFRDPANGSLSALGENTMAQIPNTIQGAMSRFNLQHRTTVFATCPSCSYIHEPLFKLGSTTPEYPTRCHHKPKPWLPVCNEPLLQPDHTPIKPYVYHHFHDFVASLLSRPEIESLIDAPCDRLMDSLSSGHPPPTDIQDVWDGAFLRSFEGPLPNTLFIDRQGESRLAFSLNVDFFNVQGVRVRGAATSCGVISCACLNLPLDIRYKPENMYLAGIVPGPNEPHGDQLNHFLDPLINDLVDSWDNGICFNHTAFHPAGRVVRSAVVCVVCDLPAARKTAQLASHSSYFYCSVCHCKDLKTRGRTDFDSDCWQLRDKDILRRQAMAYKNAGSATEQDKLFAANGVRWSPLWKLPYWDPARQLVVDAMHCILEGVTSLHVRDVLSLTTTSASAPDVTPPAFTHEFQLPDHSTNGMSATVVKQVKSIHMLLTSSAVDFDMDGDGQEKQIEVHIDLLTKRLMSKTVESLKFVAKDLDCEPTMSGRISKAKWVRALIEWRKFKPWATGPQQVRYGTCEVMERVWSVISTADTPSWLRSVPKNFGSASAGSLKADEWRTIITVYLPLALVSLWGDGTTHKSRAVALQYRAALDHTMALVSAVYIACARSTTRERALAYRTYMGAWLSGLKTIHPSAPYRTNGHMAIHIHQFLLSFGPVRSWWCFPFERLIGQLQRLPTNNKFGQLESTILSYYVQSAQLRAWLARDDCPPIIKECQALFRKAFTNPEHGETADLERLSHAQPCPPPADLYVLVSQHTVTLHARFSFNGVGYSRKSTHVGNSLIVYHVGGNASLPAVPGSIKYIFGINGKISFAVQRQCIAPADTLDSFRHYPHFPARIYSETLDTTLERVEPDWVLAHYVRWRFTPGYVVILTLFRVRSVFSADITFANP